MTSAKLESQKKTWPAYGMALEIQRVSCGTVVCVQQQIPIEGEGETFETIQERTRKRKPLTPEETAPLSAACHRLREKHVYYINLYNVIHKGPPLSEFNAGCRILFTQLGATESGWVPPGWENVNKLFCADADDYLPEHKNINAKLFEESLNANTHLQVNGKNIFQPISIVGNGVKFIPTNCWTRPIEERRSGLRPVFGYSSRCFWNLSSGFGLPNLVAHYTGYTYINKFFHIGLPDKGETTFGAGKRLVAIPLDIDSTVSAAYTKLTNIYKEELPPLDRTDEINNTFKESQEWFTQANMKHTNRIQESLVASGNADTVLMLDLLMRLLYLESAQVMIKNHNFDVILGLHDFALSMFYRFMHELKPERLEHLRTLEQLDNPNIATEFNCALPVMQYSFLRVLKPICLCFTDPVWRHTWTNAMNIKLGRGDTLIDNYTDTLYELQIDGICAVTPIHSALGGLKRILSVFRDIPGMPFSIPEVSTLTHEHFDDQTHRVFDTINDQITKRLAELDATLRRKTAYGNSNRFADSNIANEHFPMWDDKPYWRQTPGIIRQRPILETFTYDPLDIATPSNTTFFHNDYEENNEHEVICAYCDHPPAASDVTGSKRTADGNLVPPRHETKLYN